MTKEDERIMQRMAQEMRVAVATLFGIFGFLSLGWAQGSHAGFSIALAWKLVDWMVRRQAEQLERVERALSAIAENVRANGERIAQVQQEVHSCPTRLKNELEKNTREQ